MGHRHLDAEVAVRVYAPVATKPNQTPAVQVSDHGCSMKPILIM
jgi:hypothetical protein